MWEAARKRDSSDSGRKVIAGGQGGGLVVVVFAARARETWTSLAFALNLDPKTKESWW